MWLDYIGKTSPTIFCFVKAPSHIFCFDFLLSNIHRYAYSEEVGEESDDEEAQSLTRGKEEGDLSLVKLEKNVETNTILEREDDGEEDKRQ